MGLKDSDTLNYSTVWHMQYIVFADFEVELIDDFVMWCGVVWCDMVWYGIGGGERSVLVDDARKRTGILL